MDTFARKHPVLALLGVVALVLLIVGGFATGVAHLLSGGQQDSTNPVLADADEDGDLVADEFDTSTLQAPPVLSTREFTKPDSELGEWVREPTCPEGDQSIGITVNGVRVSPLFVWTNADFDESGRTGGITLTADEGNITMIYEIDWVPGAAEGNPEASSSQWSFWRHVPDWPHGQVWLEKERGFTAGDYLRVCVDR
jgi:hypothetical protein